MPSAIRLPMLDPETTGDGVFARCKKLTNEERRERGKRTPFTVMSPKSDDIDIVGGFVAKQSLGDQSRGGFHR